MKEINLNHICKIEGHAHLNLKIENGQVQKCELKASEGARFFEALVLNKKLEDIQEIVSRICGICSSAHSVAAIQTLEEAIGLKPTQQQILIREMLMIGERLRSHATHLYFMSLPDYLNAPSVLSLGPEHKSKINDALEIVSLGNKIIEAFGGREMHPFLKIKEDLPNINKKELIEKINTSKKAIYRAIELFSSLKYPDFQRETDYLSLSEENSYANISGKIKSSSGKFIDDDYKQHLSEDIKEYATSKFVLKKGESYMLGSMARINNNYKNLDDETKKVLNKTLSKLNLKLPLNNPYHNLICQAIELLEAANRAILFLQKELPKNQDDQKINIKEGRGVTAVEAPRGTLFHEYIIDKKGIITYCNIITPTAQNLNTMEHDITTLVNQLLKENNTKEKIVDKIEKLIRAYDPCFSCSTHFLKVNWE
jgi:sulfhydrogenase subunit alpha